MSQRVSLRKFGIGVLSLVLTFLSLFSLSSALASALSEELPPFQEESASVQYSPDENDVSGLWKDAVDLGGGWMWLDWLGYFNVNSSPWIYHMEHHWLYPFGSSTESIVFWDKEMNALWWTSETTYPFLYRFSDQCWLYYDIGTSDPRWFYNYCTSQWENTECVNIAGDWYGWETMTVTCSAAGVTDTETLTGSGEVTISQDGCTITWTIPQINMERTGTIEGNHVEVSGEFFLPYDVSGLTITENVFSASGTVVGNTITLAGTGSVKGSYMGISFSCSGTTSAELTRMGVSGMSEVNTFESFGSGFFLPIEGDLLGLFSPIRNE